MELSASEVSLNRKYPVRGFERALGCLCNGKYFIGQGIEIGEGGILFISDQQFSNELALVLNFQVPGGSFISVRAEIKEIKPALEAGHFSLLCAFKNLKFEHRREIRSFVSARSEATQ